MRISFFLKPATALVKLISIRKGRFCEKKLVKQKGAKNKIYSLPILKEIDQNRACIIKPTAQNGFGYKTFIRAILGFQRRVPTETHFNLN